MGNNHLKTCKQPGLGEIHIELPQTATCIGGQYAQGVVHLNLEDNFRTTSLFLRFKGYERAHHNGVTLLNAEQMYPHMRNNTGLQAKQKEPQFNDRKSASKVLLVNNRQILKNFTTGFAPKGQFSYPFSFQLPFWLPPSLIYTDNGKLTFSVYYALEAYIIEEDTIAKLGNTSTSFIGAARAKQENRMLKTKVLVKVIQPPLSVNPPKVLNVGCKLMGGFREDKGQTDLELRIDKQQYMPGESVLLTVNINNSESEKSIKATKIKFMKAINGLDVAKEKSVKMQDIIMRIKDETVIARGEQKQIQFEIPLKVCKMINGHLTKAYDDLEEGKETYQIKELPLCKYEGSLFTEYLIQPTCEGSTIQCEYYLEVTIEFKSAFSLLGGTTTQTALLPFNIYADPNLLSLPVLIPERLTWRPYVFDLYKFEIQHKNNDLEVQAGQNQRLKRYNTRDILRDTSASEKKTRRAAKILSIKLIIQYGQRVCSKTEVHDWRSRSQEDREANGQEDENNEHFQKRELPQGFPNLNMHLSFISLAFSNSQIQ